MPIKALLGFAPFLAFLLVERLFGAVPGLAAGLTVSLALLAWDLARPPRTLNLLEAGSAVMFGALTLVALATTRPWDVWEVRLYVDVGLALVVGLSVLLRRPFTMQAGRAMVTAEEARSPAFLRHNAVLSGIWGLAFTALAAIDGYMVMAPDAPDRRGIILTIVALVAAARFTRSFVKRIRAGG